MALTNDQLAKKYKISPFGGINRSNMHGVYVLKINDASVYHDEVHNDVIQYVGQGLTGDQTFTRNNRGLANSNWPCHVWKKGEDGLYRMLGEYSVDFWYWETQGGRRVIVFQLVKNVSVTQSVFMIALILLLVFCYPLTIPQIYSRCTGYGSFSECGNSTQTPLNKFYTLTDSLFERGVAFFQ